MARLKASLVFVVLLSFRALLCAQDIPLINSGEVIRQGIALYDSGAYEEAIKVFKTVPAGDTNYVYMLSELALTYNGAEKYDEAIAACREGLQQQSEHRVHFMRTLGTAYDHKGDSVQAVATYTGALEEFPFDYLLHYNLGITHYNHKAYDKAAACFINTLRINPFHAGSHLNLGVLSAFRGHKTRAMMCLGMYLSINESDNARLVLLERFLNNEIKEEGSIPCDDVNPFEKLDQIIRAKIVADKNFKAKVPVNAILVKQYQLLLEQLTRAEGEPDDFWVTFYLPLYKGIHEKNLLEPFLYHILSSTANNDVAKWRKKNGKKLDEFFSFANVRLKENRSTRTLPESWGIENPVQCWYTDGNYLDAIGREDASGTPYGKWMFYSTGGVCRAVGTYNRQGNKTGTWTYRHHNGALKSVENYDTDEMQVFDEYGDPRHRYVQKGDDIHGEVKIFYPCGLLKEKLLYENGKREGAGSTYFISGATETTYTYKAGYLEDSYVVYFENGQVQRKYIYSADTLEGPFEEYYADGRLKTKGAYRKGEPHGPWTYYYSNGRPEKSGAYHDGTLRNEWLFYDTRGRLIEKRRYDDDGEFHGDDAVYYDGKVHYTDQYDHGKLVKVTNFDRQGKETGTYGHPSGTFTFNVYYPDGALYLEGASKQGKNDGDWKYYYREGGLFKKITYANGVVQGAYTEYFKSGGVKTEQVFADDELHGYYREFYSHGQVKEEGWYQHGLREQQWRGYYPDGALQSASYYLNGYLAGESLDYSAGKISSSASYRNGSIKSLRYFNKAGAVRLGKELSGKKEQLLQHFADNKPHTQMELTCGEYSGDVQKWWPNGKPYSVIAVSNGMRHGTYRYFYANGQPEVNGQYTYGSEQGKWVWFYDTGKKYCEGYYLDGERDSTWTYYTEEGKKSMEGNYAAGERYGVFKIYGPVGTLVMERLYSQGNLVAYRALLKTGMPGDWQPFTGKATITATYANGQKAYEETYTNGILEGAQRIYYENGTLHSEYRYKDGDYNGAFAVYYPDGKLKEKGAYKYDELDGTIEHYNPDGTLRLTEAYSMGTKNGSMVVYRKGVNVDEINFWAGNIE